MSEIDSFRPLAARMRPQSLDENDERNGIWQTLPIRTR
jgi:hypothetical protein